MQTNAEYAASHNEFSLMCDELGMPKTRRQASKWRMGKGRAIKEGPPAYKARIAREEQEAEEKRQWHAAIPGLLMLLGANVEAIAA